MSPSSSWSAPLAARMDAGGAMTNDRGVDRCSATATALPAVRGERRWPPGAVRAGRAEICRRRYEETRTDELELEERVSSRLAHSDTRVGSCREGPHRSSPRSPRASRRRRRRPRVASRRSRPGSTAPRRRSSPGRPRDAEPRDLPLGVPWGARPARSLSERSSHPAEASRSSRTGFTTTAEASSSRRRPPRTRRP